MLIKKMNLKVKLIMLFLLVGLIPVLIVSFVSYHRAAANIREEVSKSLSTFLALEKESLGDLSLQHEANARMLAISRRA